MTKAELITNGKDIKLPGCTLTNTGIQFNKSATVEDWEKAGRFLARADGAIQWWIGDWLNYGEGKPQWGDRYEEAVEAFGREVQTLKNYKSVAKTFELSRRRDNLDHKHHVEVAALDPNTADELLDRAEAEGMSTRQLRTAARDAKPKEPIPAFPDSTYRVLYADPPWKYNDERTLEDDSGAAKTQYDLLSVGEICGLRDIDGRSVRDLLQPSAALFLWTTSPLIPDAMAVMSSWGFSYKSQFVWDKLRTYNGHYTAVGHELLLIGTRGGCVPDSRTLHDSVVRIERTEHSVKPDGFYDIIEAMYTEGRPFCELFARRKRAGWDSWGNQVDG